MELKHIKADGTYKKEIINEEKEVCNKSVTNQIFGGSTGLLKNYSWKNLNGRNVHAFVVEESTKGLYELYHSWYKDKKKSYEEYAEKSSMFEEKANSLEGQIKELEQRRSDKAKEVQAEEIKLDIIKMQIQGAMDDFEDMQKQTDFVKEQAVQQYEKYRRVEPSERGATMFDDMLQLKRENMILKDENRTLKEKLQKAYDFMKQFTLNGLNMLERFLESVGERVQNFSENIGFGGRGR